MFGLALKSAVPKTRRLFRTALSVDPDPKSVHARITSWQPSLQALG